MNTKPKVSQYQLYFHAIKKNGVISSKAIKTDRVNSWGMMKIE